MLVCRVLRRRLRRCSSGATLVLSFRDKVSLVSYLEHDAQSEESDSNGQDCVQDSRKPDVEVAADPESGLGRRAEGTCKKNC